MKTKRFTIFGLLLLIGITVFSQVSVIPQGFNYQAVARDSSGSPRANQTINLRFTITNQAGTNIPYIETQSKTTDQFGLFTTVIGQGAQTGGTGTFSQIDWKSNNYYLKTEIQEGLNYYVIGTEPLLTVPYAMVAREAVYAVPAGTIVPFGGTNIPSGWLLCDGASYSTTQYPELYSSIGINFGGVLGANFNVPDFRGRFLRGVDGTAGNDPNTSTRTASNTGGNTGNNVGSLQNNATVLPNSNFVLSTIADHNHAFSASGTSGSYDFSHTHSLSVSGTTLGNGSHNHGGGNHSHAHIGYAANGTGGSGAIVMNNTGGASQSYSTENSGTIISTEPNHTHTVTLTGTSGSAGSGHAHSMSLSGTSNSSGSHAHTISGGDSETRPKNVYVNYIIKY